jgi:hypothetical protein
VKVAPSALQAYPNLPIEFSADFINFTKRGDGTRKRRGNTSEAGAANSANGEGAAVGNADAPLDGTAGEGSAAPLADSSPDKSIWPDDVSTVMLRNIPNRYTPEELLDEICAQGFDDMFDFFYLPTDFTTRKNKGYGFVNLKSPVLARSFRSVLDGHRLPKYVTQKVLEMKPADTQGFDNNVLKYIKHQANRVQNAWFRPMIFKPSSDPQKGIRSCECLTLAVENLPKRLQDRLANSALTTTVPTLASVSAADTAQATSMKPLEHCEAAEADSDEEPIPDDKFLECFGAAVEDFLRPCVSDGPMHGDASRLGRTLPPGGGGRRRRGGSAARRAGALRHSEG